ncbi:MAG: 1-deoxy-D-xylulose-5-phosphate synthase [Firmicutes bacterium]|nr:1-deoxy-D-xylulose-5-phosphate synthase [Bacillota bacterium]
MKKNILDYNFPIDLKTMTDEELELLSYSIREFLIDKVSKTGGHLASNLGVVELTIALHKVFNSPVDKIIWDVGHQSYVHKILTGRGSQFDGLRKFGGLSGFPKSNESPHDAYDTGHSSTSVSAAAGMACAREINGDDYEVIAVIGDGSLTGGMAYEALNNIGASKSKVIVILNDNGMSISKNIGGISTHLGTLRTSKGYLSAKKFIKNTIGSSGSVGSAIAGGLAGFKNDIKYSIIEKGGVLFEELGFTYFGPVDGHNIPDLVNVLNRAKSLDEPVLIHVITQKGKGYKNAEKAPGKFHGIGPFNPETGEIIKKSIGPTYSEIMGNHLVKLAEKDARIVAITAAMGEATGLGPFEKKFPERFFDVGIAEQHAVSFAAGLAKCGIKPVCAIYSSFLQRAYDQIMEDVCMQKLPVVFAIDRAGVVGADGETHHGIYDLSYLMTMPGMTVLTPHDGPGLELALDYAINLETPSAVRYPRGEADEFNNIDNKKTMSTNNRTVKNQRILSGKDVDIWACGKMYDFGIKVVEMLKDRGIDAGLVDVEIVKPLDLDAFEKNCRLLVTIEDNDICSGFGMHMAAELKNEEIKILNFGWPDKFIEQGSFDELASQYGMMPEQITERICEYIEGKA